MRQGGTALGRLGDLSDRARCRVGSDRNRFRAVGVIRPTAPTPWDVGFIPRPSTSPSRAADAARLIRRLEAEPEHVRSNAAPRGSNVTDSHVNRIVGFPAGGAPDRACGRTHTPGGRTATRSCPTRRSAAAPGSTRRPPPADDHVEQRNRHVGEDADLEEQRLELERVGLCPPMSSSVIRSAPGACGSRIARSKRSPIRMYWRLRPSSTCRRSCRSSRRGAMPNTVRVRARLVGTPRWLSDVLVSD